MEEVVKGEVSPYLRENEVPPFPVHSNWKEMIHSENEVEGLNDTGWTLTINRYKPGTLALIEDDDVKIAMINLDLR